MKNKYILLFLLCFVHQMKAQITPNVRFDDAYSVGNQYYPAGYTDFIPVITLYGLYNDSGNRKVRLMVDGLLAHL